MTEAERFQALLAKTGETLVFTLSDGSTQDVTCIVDDDDEALNVSDFDADVVQVVAFTSLLNIEEFEDDISSVNYLDRDWQVQVRTRLDEAYIGLY